MKIIKMSKKDVEDEIRAVVTLTKLNKKYGFPYGANPFGIIFYITRLAMIASGGKTGSSL